MSTLTITCSNCYQERDVDPMHIGSELKQFYKDHKTRIGRTYCKFEDLCIRYEVTRKVAS